MAALHTAFKALAPITYSDLPTDESELKTWLSDLFQQAQVVLDSIPIAEPAEPTDPKSSSSSVASNASEMIASSARPPPPSAEHQALQKEWGKPIKLGAKENSLGMSVYKVSGKDGKGAWFSRRSVHEGISFSRFKKALEMEFPESLAVQGAPGEGNVRGIGGETKVEDIKVPSKGRVEVYRLSAQFPGPTTPRDFVTMLITSENAMKAPNPGDQVLRHYMIISKPCDHPETQPQSGFIRGLYESVEFIREVPRQIPTSHSDPHLPEEPIHQDTVSKSAMIRNAEQKTKSFPLDPDSPASESTSDHARKRSSTAPSRSQKSKEPEDSHPVEWIMVTRSDPGGSVPRFMVERGTPSSICADAEKFLNWACKQDFDDEEVANAKDSQVPVDPIRRDSYQSFRSSRIAGVEEGHGADKEVVDTLPENRGMESSGIFGAVSGAAHYLSSYTPQVVLDHLPGSNKPAAESAEQRVDVSRPDDDAVSEASFESADSHVGTSESGVASPSSSRAEVPTKSSEHLNHHEKELRKLEQRRAALENKFSESHSRLENQISTQTSKEDLEKKKATEKHEKELKKHKEKYEKELKKIDERHAKERKKLEEKQKKQMDKDEKSRLTRERDEAREELEIVKKEASLLRSTVEDLQKQNTELAAKLGKVGLVDDALSGDNKSSSSHGSQKGHKSGNSTSTSIKSQ